MSGIAIAQWHAGEKMARPGIVFELRNAEGLTMLSPCTAQVPEKPFDWKSFVWSMRRDRSGRRRCRRRRERPAQAI